MENTKPHASQIRYGSGDNRVDKTLKRSVLSFSDYAVASTAADTLPDGQQIEAPNAAGRLSRFSVQSGVLVFKDFAPDAIRMQSYSAIGNYTGSAQAIDITTPGISGRWNCRGVVPGVVADYGTKLIDALGRLWERDFSGPWRFEWFGAKGDKVTDDSDIISSVLNQAKGAVVITAGKGFRIDGYSLRATTALVSGTDTSQVTVTHPITFPKLPAVNVSAYDNPGASGYWLPLGRATSTSVIVYSKKLEAGNAFTGNMNLQIDASLKEF